LGARAASAQISIWRPISTTLVARQLEIVADLSALRLTAANSASCQRGDFKA